jgi:hypothetical protein
MGVTNKKQEFHKFCGKLKHSKVNSWKTLFTDLWKKIVVKFLNKLSTVENAKNFLVKFYIYRKLAV